ncbi:hypothetical protein [Bacteroides oleiciplenus]|uniref:hypothetical protein n=1 Tax=Bacteroides oleiciplenus TaxID=626931 RepID=UPI0026DDA517|nr:hypothetical protein [Bacteroides oleiciplenus]
MKKLIISILLLTILSVSFVKTGVKASTPTGVTDTNRNVIDTTGILFLLDWKRVTSQWAMENFKNNKIILHGTHEAKKAVLFYGEKYRTGVYFCEITKDPDK